MASPATAQSAARQYVAWDVNEETRAQAQALLDAGATSAFASRLEFGTAGLRGPMGPGFSRMNDLVVLQTAQGLAAYLVAVFGDRARTGGLVLGYDHRSRGSLNSRRFALLTAAAALRAGVRVHLFRRLVATPLVPFAIRHLGAVAGVMVTASHNPKEDNGYKVYWENGSQIIPPHDAGISAAIDANLEPAEGGKPYAAERLEEEAIRSHPLCAPDTTDAVVAAYLGAVRAALCRHEDDNRTSPVRVCYTAMHGVGLPFAAAAFEAFGHRPFAQTREQVEPDPGFPTVPFPNPEEGKGALALAMRTAEREGCTLILANDPDADRLAVAEWVPAAGAAGAAGVVGGDGEWRVFSGNEIGALLAHWAWTCYRERTASATASASSSSSSPTKPPVMIASTVSSKFLQALAEREGFVFQETLTGFKWMGNAMDDHERNGEEVLFSFEEAIGFCCGTVVRDKDGVSGAAVFAEMAGQLRRRHGRTCAEHLRAIYDTYGHFVTNNYYLLVDDPAKTAAIFARLRNGGHYWMRMGDLAVRSVRDLTGEGWDSEGPDGGRPTLPTSNGTQMLTYKVRGGMGGGRSKARARDCRAPPPPHTQHLFSCCPPLPRRSSPTASSRPFARPAPSRSSSTTAKGRARTPRPRSGAWFVVWTHSTSRGPRESRRPLASSHNPPTTLPSTTRREVDRTVELILNEMLQPEVHGLKRPVRA
jgi:phosphoglucomutase / phosphopentomutase